MLLLLPHLPYSFLPPSSHFVVIPPTSFLLFLVSSSRAVPLRSHHPLVPIPPALSVTLAFYMRVAAFAYPHLRLPVWVVIYGCIAKCASAGGPKGEDTRALVYGREEWRRGEEKGRGIGTNCWKRETRDREAQGRGYREGRRRRKIGKVGRDGAGVLAS